MTATARRGPGAGALIAAAGIVLLLAAAFIVLRPGSAACPAESASFVVAVDETGMTPSALEACRGQEVVLEVQSAVDGVFHIHGLDEVVPATEIFDGEELTLRFTPTTARVYGIELHTHHGENVELGTLTVNVP